MGYEDLDMFHSPQLERIVAGIRRLKGEANTRERNPVTKEILLRLLPQFDRTTLHGVTIQASFCLAFAAFLRVGEFTYNEKDMEDEDFSEWFLTRRSVKLSDNRPEATNSGYRIPRPPRIDTTGLQNGSLSTRCHTTYRRYQ